MRKIIFKSFLLFLGFAIFAFFAVFSCGKTVSSNPSSTIPSPAVPSWHILGNPPGTNVDQVEFEIDRANGDLYVGYHETISTEVKVCKYNGSVWVNFSSVGVLGMADRGYSFGVHNGDVFIYYEMLANGTEGVPAYTKFGATLSPYTNETWSNVGRGTNYTNVFLMAVNDQSIPFLTKLYSGQLDVVTYESGNFIVNNVEYNNHYNNYPLALTKDLSTSSVFIAYKRELNPGVGNMYLAVKYFHNGDWPASPASNWDTIEDLPADQASMASYDDHPYITYPDSASYRAIVKKINDSNEWVTVGSSEFSPGAANGLSIALDTISGVTPYVAFTEDYNSSGSYLSVMKFNGSYWEFVGERRFAGNAYSPKIRIYNGVVYVGCRRNGLATVYRFGF